MSTIIATTLSNGSVSVPTATVVNGSAKAWVNFNGTGTIAARDSFNVASLTDDGTGNYTVNFTTAFTDANYSLILTGTYGSSNAFNGTAPTTTAAKVQTYVTTTAVSQDSAHVAVAIHR